MSISFKKQDGDLYRNAFGRLTRIQGEEKLAQNIADQLMTTYDPVRGVGSEVRAQSKAMVNPGVMPAFGETFITEAIQDCMQRLFLLQDQSPRTTDTERLDPSSVQVNTVLPNRKEFMFYITCKPVKGSPMQIPPYRVRLRQQYPGQSARSVFPKSVTTDDMIP